MSLNKYNNLLASGKFFNKYPKYAEIMDLVGTAQNLAHGTNKSSEKSDRGYTKVVLYLQ